MSEDESKQIFKESLQGVKHARDLCGRLLMKGQIIGYATTRGKNSIMKIAKILEVHRFDLTQDEDKVFYSLKIWGAQAEWSGKEVTLHSRATTLQNIKNTIVIENPPEQIVQLFKDV